MYEDLLTLVFAGVGFGLMLRLIRLRTALMIILGAALLPLLLPPSWNLLLELPLVVSLFIVAILGIVLHRLLIRPLLGRPAADSMAGNLASNLVKVILVPFRIVRRLIGQFTD